MTKAVINRLNNGDIIGFSIRGHAGAAKNGEYDMVCAAISAVGYTALGGLEELCGVNTYKESDGNLTMNLPEDMAAEDWATAQIILKTMEIGLKQIENDYSKHIHVSIKEV
ncbi:MAG: ribosomal-processing cysteine protease Prp [Acetivibrionales bacterium]|jgi:uncharacterized protein YsxB (DUF464 family)|nr:ribosomal-processing cysteine protease Prp [Clostridiaceae bacterium]